MRIRQVLPAFWTDAKLAELSTDTRLTYIGLWCLADDAGYFERGTVEIAAELYPYDLRRTRERRVEKALAELLAGRHIEELGCDRHAVVRRLARYQRVGETKRVYPVRRRHAEDCAPATSPGFPGIPGTSGPGTGRDGTGRDGKGRDVINAHTGASETDDLDNAMGPERAERIRRRAGVSAP